MSLSKKVIKPCKTHILGENVHNVITTFDVVYLEMTSTPRRALFARPVTYDVQKCKT